MHVAVNERPALECRIIMLSAENDGPNKASGRKTDESQDGGTR